jgi:hypothetical protein
MAGEMRAVVVERVNVLQLLSFEAIKALPAQRKERLGTIQITQYHDVLGTGEHVVVVQALQQRWLGIFTAIELDGFVTATDGSKRPPTEQERWPFM